MSVPAPMFEAHLISSPFGCTTTFSIVTGVVSSSSSAVNPKLATLVTSTVSTVHGSPNQLRNGTHAHLPSTSCSPSIGTDGAKVERACTLISRRFQMKPMRGPSTP